MINDKLQNRRHSRFIISLLKQKQLCLLSVTDRCLFQFLCESSQVTKAYKCARIQNRSSLGGCYANTKFCNRILPWKQFELPGTRLCTLLPAYVLSECFVTQMVQNVLVFRIVQTRTILVNQLSPQILVHVQCMQSLS